MKRRLLSLVLVLALLATPALNPSAATQLDGDVLPALKALEIMVGDETGKMNLSASVSRAEFAKLLIASSSHKDALGGQGAGYSLFTDVKSSHWASEYIKLCLDQGWMIGYTDGSFRPDNTVTLEEACTAALRLLGFDSSNLSGSFPAAQLNKASAVGLRDGVDAQRGQALKRQDCAQLFYNLLTCKTAQGQVYAATLGYQVNADGELDYQAIIDEKLEGPFLADGTPLQLGFVPTTVLRDGESAQLGDLQRNDVYYFNPASQTLWVYSDQVSGKIEALTPSALSPTAVTISGKSYTLGTDALRRELSSLNGKWTGKFVTLLFGMDDSVVGILSGDEVETTYYGVVQSSGKVAQDGLVEQQVKLLGTDGRSHTFTTTLTHDYEAGDLIQVNIANGGVTLAPLTSRSFSGSVNQGGSRAGNYSFADDLEILDTAEDGTAATVEAASLAGLSLSSSNVRFYRLNSQGEVDRLILNDATGVLWSYGFLVSQEQQGSGMNLSARYTLMLDGQSHSVSVSGKAFPVTDRQGVAVRVTGYTPSISVGAMQSLKSTKLASVGKTTASSGSQSFPLADKVDVYLKDEDGDYHAVALSDVTTGSYTLTGWYDTTQKLIRVIVAQEG